MTNEQDTIPPTPVYGFDKIQVQNMGWMSTIGDIVNTDLQKIETAISTGGSGDYTTLSNKPEINSVELSGNKTSAQLGIVSEAPSDGKIYGRTNGTWSELSTTALKPMKSEWESHNITTSQAAQLILEDSSVKKGDGYLGEVRWSDLSTFGIGNAEVIAYVKDSGIVEFQMTSSNVSPYSWFFSSAANVWRSQVPVVDALTSTSQVEALSANCGKFLNDLIGDLSTLTTTDKSSIVAAINEIDARLRALET